MLVMLMLMLLLPLHQLHAAGYRIRLCGHSLGAGVASILTILLRPLLGDVSCVGFATPPVLASLPLLSAAQHFITRQRFQKFLDEMIWARRPVR